MNNGNKRNISLETIAIALFCCKNNELYARAHTNVQCGCTKLGVIVEFEHLVKAPLCAFLRILSVKRKTSAHLSSVNDLFIEASFLFSLLFVAVTNRSGLL